MNIIKSDYIRDKLSYIQSKIRNDTNLKLYNINITAEDLFMNILNLVYNWELRNVNKEIPNFPAIDLIDTKNEIVIQVTSNRNKKKVKNDTIEAFNNLVKEDKYKKYSNYQIKIFYINGKPPSKTLVKWEKEGIISQSDILGIEDINSEISGNYNLADNLFKMFCKFFHDDICVSNIKNISNFDKELYEVFLNDLPTKGSISFINEFNFHYPYKINELEQLFIFNNKWDTAEYEFINKDVEIKKINFCKKLDSFLYELGMTSAPINHNGTQSIIPIEYRYGEKPNYLLEEVSKINFLAKEVYELHQDFIRYAKKYLYK